MTTLVLLSYVLIAFIITATYKFTERFRDLECEGVISYGKAFSFILYTFFFGALISSAVKFVYFQFINPPYLENLLNESMKAIEIMKIPVDDKMYEQMESLLKPATFSLQYIWMNTLFGSLIGLIIAAVVKKGESTLNNSEEK